MEKIYTLFYSIGQGMKNIKRNRMFSITSIITITASLFLFGIFYFLTSNVQYMVHNMEKSVSVSVFFEDTISEEQIQQIGAALKRRTDVKKVEYISAEQAWEHVKKDMFEDNPELIETFSEDNPLANSSSYEVYIKDVSKQARLVKAIKQMEGVRKVNSSDETAKALTNFNRLLSVISLTIIAILIAVAVFLISTTITVGITVRKEEIAIMRLIGATDFFVQGPFIVEGIIIGLIGSLIPLGVLAILYVQIIKRVNHAFVSLSQWLVFLSVKSEFSILVPVCLGIGVGIGLLGSCITVQKHLRV